MTKEEKFNIIIFVISVIIVVTLGLGSQYIKAALFYEGDLRCMFADCRIAK